MRDSKKKKRFSSFFNDQLVKNTSCLLPFFCAMEEEPCDVTKEGSKGEFDFAY